ncbi:MAG: pyridine nucleotide-disulfide oxidoreductase [Pseudomonadota bacterium]
MNATTAESAVGLSPAPKMSAAAVGLLLATIVIGLGWVVPLRDYITPRTGLGYTLGIVGGSLMLVLLIYPARKRIPGLAFIGSARWWFRFHMALGVAGPICILYHCGYRTGATNSNVALWSMIIVAGSGVIGRYLYSRIHFGLYGSRASLNELHHQASNLKTEGTGAGRLLPGFGARLDQSEKLISMTIPLVPQANSAFVMWYLERMRVRAFIKRTLREAAKSSLAISEHRATLLAAACRYSDARLGASRRVAEFRSCERLFSLWHILHLPLFGMLFVAGIVHVIAVNIY